MTTRRRETGEPWGVPSGTGEKTLEEAWKRRWQDLPVRKD